ncbi:MAG: hypothetical protein IH900_06410 [Proteobacteria bacterium]|nr:hypothetical protein [Pseudomonadota bacterium]
MTYLALSKQKTTSSLDLTFEPAFSSTPVVLLTPYWKGQNAAVGSVPTLTKISPNAATVISGNQATNYYVNVLAIDAGAGLFGDLAARAGSALKAHSTLEIQLEPHLDAPDPVTLLSSFWTSGVGSIDTVDDEAASEIKVVSGNQAPNYFTQYLCTDRGLGADVQVGTANKAGGEILRVYFPIPWSSEPLIFVSPWWKDANAGVGGVETVSNVTDHYFEVVSNNVASNYFVNWMAVRPTG